MSTGRPSSEVRERRLLERARAGDEHAFGQLVEPYRAALRAHGYRMLGSVPDAEDALQEALLRAWRGLPRFEGRSSLRSWLYSIAMNVCLRMIERRPKRVLPVDYGPPRHLPARQRAVLLLRDVLGFAPGEIAAVLDASPASIYSALQRAHRAVEERLPARSQQATLRAIGDQRLRDLVERYVNAWEEGDV